MLIFRLVFTLCLPLPSFFMSPVSGKKKDRKKRVREMDELLKKKKKKKSLQETPTGRKLILGFVNESMLHQHPP